MQGFLLAFTSIFAGPVLDRGHPHWLILCGGFLVVLGFMMTSLCTTYWQLMLAQGVCIGLGSGQLFIVAVAIIPGWFSKYRALTTGLCAAGSAVGGIIYPIVFYRLQPMIGFGWACQAWDFEGKDVSEKGEAADLVCVKPFPCQPVAFWGKDGDAKYRASYFEEFEGVWHHGDFIRFNPRTGGLVMLGRSDGVLKPSGVRFGSAELYNVILKHFSAEVEDALAIGRRREQDDDETVVLFLKMKDGVTFGEELVQKIKATVRTELSARHVPGVVDECPDIPVTVNGKKVEKAVKVSKANDIGKRHTDLMM
jgi:acyl-CoA synthetase (AMP-forming)/AMP-acid ligase II